MLRENPTPAQQAIMKVLDKRGIKYRFQSIRFKDVRRIFDFYIPKCRAVIEIDENYDARARGLTEDTELTERVPTLKVLRLFSHEVLYNPETSMAKLCELIGPVTSSASSVPSESSDNASQLNLL